MLRMVKRGEIYYADLDPISGSEQGGNRPVLILSNDLGNIHSSTVVVAAITHNRKKKTQFTHCVIRKECGLKCESIVLAEQIRTVDKNRLTEFVGKLSEKSMRKINYAIMVSLGLMGTEKQKEMVLTLCPACAGYFYDSPDYYIWRTDMSQKYKETCNYCQSRGGYTFSIVTKAPDVHAVFLQKIC